MRRVRRIVAAVLAAAPMSCINVVGLGGYTIDESPVAADAGSGGASGADATTPPADGSAPDAVAAVCSAATPDKCTVDCSAGGSCPSGMSCVRSACVAPSSCSPEAGITCIPFGQCGCSAEQSCVQDLYGMSDAGRCITPGSGAPGTPCDIDGKCRIGLACYEGICSAYCATPADCGLGADGACKLLGRENVCFHTCDPFAEPSPCGSGAKCAIPTDVVLPAVCMRAGAKTQGGTCSVDQYACASGYTCMRNGICRKLCRLGGSDCTASCDAVTGTIYGVCTNG